MISFLKCMFSCINSTSFQFVGFDPILQTDMDKVYKNSVSDSDKENNEDTKCKGKLRKVFI